MNEQITLFQWLADQTDLDKISEPDMVEQIGAALGVKFTKNDFFGDYRVKIGKITLCLEYSTYFDDGRRFIGADVETKSAGASSPCDSIEEAINFFKRTIPKFKKEKAERETKTA